MVLDGALVEQVPRRGHLRQDVNLRTAAAAALTRSGSQRHARTRNAAGRVRRRGLRTASEHWHRGRRDSSASPRWCTHKLRGLHRQLVHGDVDDVAVRRWDVEHADGLGGEACGLRRRRHGATSSSAAAQPRAVPPLRLKVHPRGRVADTALRCRRDSVRVANAGGVNAVGVPADCHTLEVDVTDHDTSPSGRLQPATTREARSDGAARTSRGAPAASTKEGQPRHVVNHN